MEDTVQPQENQEGCRPALGTLVLTSHSPRQCHSPQKVEGQEPARQRTEANH